MSTLLIVFHVIICILLVLVVLVQSGKDGGLGTMGGGSSQTVFGSSGGANFFTKFTSVVAALFMITSIALTLNHSGHKKSVFEDAINKNAQTTTPEKPASTPAPEKAPEQKSK